MRTNRLLADKGLNQFDEDLEGKTFIAGDRIIMADIMLYGANIATAPATQRCGLDRPHEGKRGQPDDDDPATCARRKLEHFR